MLDLNHQDLITVQQILGMMIPEYDVWAFGSRVKKHAHPGSDLDLVIRNPRALDTPYKKMTTLKATFRESNLPFLLDIVDWAQIPESFRTEIESVHTVIQESKNSGVLEP